MDYTLWDIINGLGLVQDGEYISEITRLEREIELAVAFNGNSFMEDHELCLSMVESWLNKNIFKEYDYDEIEHHIWEWYYDFSQGWEIPDHMLDDDDKLAMCMKTIEI